MTLALRGYGPSLQDSPEFCLYYTLLTCVTTNSCTTKKAANVYIESLGTVAQATNCTFRSGVLLLLHHSMVSRNGSTCIAGPWWTFPPELKSSGKRCVTITATVSKWKRTECLIDSCTKPLRRFSAGLNILHINSHNSFWWLNGDSNVAMDPTLNLTCTPEDLMLLVT